MTHHVCRGGSGKYFAINPLQESGTPLAFTGLLQQFVFSGLDAAPESAPATSVNPSEL